MDADSAIQKTETQVIKRDGEITEYKCISVIQTRYAEMIITR